MGLVEQSSGSGSKFSELTFLPSPSSNLFYRATRGLNTQTRACTVSKQERPRIHSWWAFSNVAQVVWWWGAKIQKEVGNNYHLSCPLRNDLLLKVVFLFERKVPEEVLGKSLTISWYIWYRFEPDWLRWSLEMSLYDSVTPTRLCSESAPACCKVGSCFAGWNILNSLGAVILMDQFLWKHCSIVSP